MVFVYEFILIKETRGFLKPNLSVQAKTTLKID